MLVGGNFSQCTPQTDDATIIIKMCLLNVVTDIKGLTFLTRQQLPEPKVFFKVPFKGCSFPVGRGTGNYCSLRKGDAGPLVDKTEELNNDSKEDFRSHNIFKRGGLSLSTRMCPVM